MSAPSPFRGDRIHPEHIVDAVIAADAHRRQAMGFNPPRFKRWTRTWIEPWFNALGVAFGFLTLLIPPAPRRRLYLWLCPKLGGHAPSESPHLPERRDQTVLLAKALYQKTGRWPAFLVATSHGETTGPLQWLRFEMLRQGLEVANAVVDSAPGHHWKSHPQCMVAIDPFALDTVSVMVGGFYAGWMHSIYLAWDRQPSTQSWLQRHVLLRGSTYRHVFWRLIGRLREGIPLLMVYSGGLAHNARMLYGAREFIHSLKIAPWKMTKRSLERRLLDILRSPEMGERPAERGFLSADVSAQVSALLVEAGVSDQDRAEALERLRYDFRPAVPRRERLIRSLWSRLVKKGQPLLVLAISHRDQEPFVVMAKPCGVIQEEQSLVFLDGDINRPLPLHDCRELAGRLQAFIESPTASLLH